MICNLSDSDDGRLMRTPHWLSIHSLLRGLSQFRRPGIACRRHHGRIVHGVRCLTKDTHSRIRFSRFHTCCTRHKKSNFPLLLIEPMAILTENTPAHKNIDLLLLLPIVLRPYQLFVLTFYCIRTRRQIEPRWKLLPRRSQTD